jgi:hypothetical protein
MSEYGGMTVNERVVMSGLHVSFDDAGRRRDRAKMIEILVMLEMTADGAAVVADQVLAHPARYGL